ncbi:hypothetical protein, partial [[Eubacterium] cellulosolvens]
MARPHIRNKVPGVICILVFSLMFLGSFAGAVIGGNVEAYNTDPKVIGRSSPAEPTNDNLIEVLDYQPSGPLTKIPTTDLEIPTEMVITPEEGAAAVSPAQMTRTITIPLTFPNPTVVQEYGYSRLAMPDLTVTGMPGEPEVLTKTLNLKFQPGTEFHSIEFIPAGVTSDTLTAQLIPVREPIPLSEIYKNSKFESRTISPNQLIYSTPAPFPEHWFSYDKGSGIDLETGQQTLFLNIRLFPVKYIPVQNEIIFAQAGTVTVNYTPPSTPSLTTSRSRNSQLNPEYELLIISPDNQEFQENLSRLAKFKNGLEISTILVNLSAINNGDYFP